MAYTGMTITQVSGGSITAADTNLTLSGNVTVDHLNSPRRADRHGPGELERRHHLDERRQLHPSRLGSTRQRRTAPPAKPGRARSPASPPPSPTSTTPATSSAPRCRVAAERDGGATLTSSNSAAIPVDTTADAATAATLAFADPLVNATEATATSYTVSGLDADATAAITFTSSGGGTRSPPT